MRNTQIEPADMLLYVIVAREGGFTAAANRTGVSKQAVSERVGRLEQRLGVRLLERSSRNLRMTDAGARYYERCTNIADLVDEANDEIRGRAAQPVGLLRVSVPTIFGRRYVMPVVGDLLAKHPRLSIDVVLADRRVSLIEEGFDLAIRVGNLDGATLVARKLGEGHVHYVASPAYIARHGAPAFSSVPRLPCIGLSPRESWRLGGKNVTIEPRVVVNDLELVHQAAVAGLGMARLPTFVYRESVAAGRLRLVLDSEPALRMPIHAVYPSRRQLSAKVRVFVDMLARYIEGKGILALA